MADNRNSSQQSASSGVSSEEKRSLYVTKAGAWLTAAAIVEESADRLEPHEKEAFTFIRNIFKSGKNFDKTEFVEAQNALREAATLFSDDFGTALGKFASASSNISKDYDLFKDCLNEIEKRAGTAPIQPQEVASKQRKTLGEIGDPKPKLGVHQDSVIIGGSKWEGWFDGEKPVRTGKITFRNGVVYEGEWSTEGPDGKGILTWSNGEKWNATFRNGDPTYGIIEYPSGNKYEGGLNENGPHGHGKFYYKDRTDEGEYADGERTGSGRIDWKSGDWYQGGWTDDGFEGEGTYFNANNGRRDHGTYHMGNRVGKGRLEWPNGEWYEGDWDDNGPNGYGSWCFGTNRDIYRGDYVSGARKGRGTILFSSGDRYDGSWWEDNEGNLYGDGVYTWKDGTTQNGSYVKNQWQKASSGSQGTFSYSQQQQQRQGTFSYQGSGNHSSYSSGPSAFDTIRNIIAWIIAAPACLTTFGMLQADDGVWYGVIGCAFVIWIASFIYAGDGIDKYTWGNPASIFGICLCLNALIYIGMGIFGEGYGWRIVGGIIWGIIGLAAIGYGTEDTD